MDVERKTQGEQMAFEGLTAHVHIPRRYRSRPQHADCDRSSTTQCWGVLQPAQLACMHTCVHLFMHDLTPVTAPAPPRSVLCWSFPSKLACQGKEAEIFKC
eukprot:364100-Chlamydomonas_euryale.AAC.63